MRILVLLLVFAIGFSGFSAAAHAVDLQKCGQTLSVEEVDDTQDACAQHVKNDFKEKQASKDVEHSCINCGHCCMSHATIMQGGISILVPILKTTFVNIISEPDDDFISGLKRPPRILA